MKIKCYIVVGSNQTVAGLKSRSRYSSTFPVNLFKSDRGGIEIEDLKNMIIRDGQFKSDRGGIEILHNRVFVSRCIEFKSDRGGIEISERIFVNA